MKTRPLSSQRGTTLVSILLLLFAILTLTVGGLIAVGSDMKISNNYQTGFQALLAAEAGVLHAKEFVDDMGVVSFASDVVTPWSTLFGTGSRTIPETSGVTYQVSMANDPFDTARYVLVNAVGKALNESERSIQVRLERDRVFSPGAVYLPALNVDTTFNGNAFLIDGHDTNLDGSHNTEPGSDVPGIGTPDPDTAEEVADTLSSGQRDNVIGDGGIPSVFRAAGPSSQSVTTTIAPNMLSQPGVVTNPGLSGNDVFGTIAHPQITHFTNDLTINGNLSGVGILIVDQGLRINGSASFVGLIIVRGTTEITSVSGNATILGALWTTDLQLSVSGSASVTYSSQALELANAIQPGEKLLPERVKIVYWKET
ncbi:MAG: hypothetical protein QOD06_346 [Candidatus Binatota bacterium]|nr:hypothetical protein [Candidatus Binatota bacterium]